LRKGEGVKGGTQWRAKRSLYALSLEHTMWAKGERESDFENLLGLFRLPVKKGGYPLPELRAEATSFPSAITILLQSWSVAPIPRV